MDCTNLELQDRNGPETPIMVALKRGGEAQETFAEEGHSSSAKVSLIGTIDFITTQMCKAMIYFEIICKFYTEVQLFHLSSQLDSPTRQ